MELRSPSREVRKSAIVALSGLLLFFYGFLLGGMQLVMTDVSASFGAGAAGVGLLVSVQHITSAIAPGTMGMLADRIGKKPVLVAFCIIFGLGCAVSGLSHGLGTYIIGICLIGAGYSVCESQSSAVLSDFGEKDGARFINLTQGFLCIGAIISPILCRACMSRFGADWRLVFLFCAPCFIVIAVLLMPAVFPQPVSDGQGTRKKHSRSLLSSRVLLCLMAAVFLYVGLENGFGYFVGSLFSDILGKDALDAPAISAYWAGMAICRFICVARSFDTKKLLTGCLLLAAAAFAVLAVSRLAVVSLIVCFFVGVSYGPVWTMLIAQAGTKHPEHSAAAIGLMSTACGLGGIVYPAIMGAVAQTVSLRSAFVLLGVTALGCLALFRQSERIKQ